VKRREEFNGAGLVAAMGLFQIRAKLAAVHQKIVNAARVLRSS
jgi:hypothetical protein